MIFLNVQIRTFLPRRIFVSSVTLLMACSSCSGNAPSCQAAEASCFTVFVTDSTSAAVAASGIKHTRMCYVEYNSLAEYDEADI